MTRWIEVGRTAEPLYLSGDRTIGAGATVYISLHTGANDAVIDATVHTGTTTAGGGPAGYEGLYSAARRAAARRAAAASRRLGRGFQPNSSGLDEDERAAQLDLPYNGPDTPVNIARIQEAYLNDGCERSVVGHLPQPYMRSDWADGGLVNAMHWGCQACGADMCFKGECPIPDTSHQPSPA